MVVVMDEEVDEEEEEEEEKEEDEKNDEEREESLCDILRYKGYLCMCFVLFRSVSG